MKIMPRVSIDTENKVAKVNYDFPKLKLKKDEKARIIVGLEDPLVEYVHTLQRPVIEAGVPVIINKTRKDGSTYEDYKKAFVTRAICLGRPDVLAETGLDAKNCTMCATAKDHPDYLPAPQRRYAMHVLKYKTKPGTFDIVLPFNVETLVWVFTDTVFNNLADLRAEHSDLRKKDLLLTQRGEVDFGQADITIGSKAEWLTDEDRKRFTIETFRATQIPDLSIALGSTKERSWIEMDLKLVLDSWSEVERIKSPRVDSTLDADLSTLLDKHSLAGTSSDAKSPSKDDTPLALSDLVPDDPTPEVASSSDSSETLVDDLLGLDDIAESPEATSEAVQESSGDDAPTVDNFDDLLKSFNA